KAARAAVDLVKLDVAWVLLRRGDGWDEAAVCTSPRAERQGVRPPSRHVLDRVRQEKSTFWDPAGSSVLEAASLQHVDAVIAAPVLSADGQVIGAVYGDRRQGSGPAGPGPLTEVEAMLVEVLARVVDAGMVRIASAP